MGAGAQTEPALLRLQVYRLENFWGLLKALVNAVSNVHAGVKRRVEDIRPRNAPRSAATRR